MWNLPVLTMTRVAKNRRFGVSDRSDLDAGETGYKPRFGLVTVSQEMINVRPASEKNIIHRYPQKKKKDQTNSRSILHRLLGSFHIGGVPKGWYVNTERPGRTVEFSLTSRDPNLSSPDPDAADGASEPARFGPFGAFDQARCRLEIEAPTRPDGWGRKDPRWVPKTSAKMWGSIPAKMWDRSKGCGDVGSTSAFSAADVGWNSTRDDQRMDD